MNAHKNIHFRRANQQDCQMYFTWANDLEVRKNSYKQEKISFEQHKIWYENQLNSSNSFLYVFLTENEEPVGQVRIEIKAKKAVIGISIDENFRGKSLASTMLLQASSDFFNQHPNIPIHAYIKKENKASQKSFHKAGFVTLHEVEIHGAQSYELVKKH
ncbi:MAG TPA: GNAT family N-acetyltransferase [Fluviicola sp.]|nr:GNAT family N-acetyltransferase [Fluviicola sp.]